jgi:lipid-binding SYLF domain-containing protein
MRSIVGLVAVASVAVCAPAAAQRVKDFSEAIDRFRQNEVIQPYFDSAYGYAVWDTIAKGGLGIGAATGRGQVYRNGRVTGFSRIVDISFGLQAGGQAYSQIIFFENEDAYDRFTSGKFQFDAQASAVAVTANAQASAGTEGGQASAGAGGPGTARATGYHNGMQVFTMAKGGLMYEAAISGQKYNFTPVNE